MSCPWQDKVAQYVDDEMDAAAEQQFSAHLHDCHECGPAVNAQMEFKKALRTAGHSFNAPPELHAQVYRMIHAPKAVSPWWKWAMAPVCVILLGIIGYQLIPKARPDPMMARLVDQHVTNLASANPVDVVSTDRHTVKPWFQGKLAFTFNLPEIAGSNFKLDGGKVVYAEQRSGAELWYEAGPHKMSVFVFQARESHEKPSTNHELSFNVTRWTQGGLEYFLVTDASQDEAGKLVQMFKDANRS